MMHARRAACFQRASVSERRVGGRGVDLRAYMYWAPSPGPSHTAFRDLVRSNAAIWAEPNGGPVANTGHRHGGTYIVI